MISWEKGLWEFFKCSGIENINISKRPKNCTDEHLFDLKESRIVLNEMICFQLYLPLHPVRLGYRLIFIYPDNNPTLVPGM
jgi:hypothetical protein